MEKLSIGQRTLRSEISELNEMLRKEKVSIHSGSGGGYYVKSSDKAVIQNYLDGMIRQSKRMVLPETSRERFLFGFAWLFFRREPVSIQRAAEKLCASNTAVLHTKKQIQDTLTWYPGLRLETGTRGMWISGSEAEKRHALAQFINYSTFGSIMMERLMTFLFGAGPYEDYMTFYRGLPDILAAQGCRLIDKSVEGFALDLFVTLMRSQKGFVLDEQETPDFCPCVDALAEWVEKAGYTLSARGKAYLTECLQARRILYTLGKDDAAPEEYIEVTREFLTAVDQEFGTEYRRNEELCGKLSVHIMVRGGGQRPRDFLPGHLPPGLLQPQTQRTGSLRSGGGDRRQYGPADHPVLRGRNPHSGDQLFERIPQGPSARGYPDFPLPDLQCPPARKDQDFLCRLPFERDPAEENPGLPAEEHAHGIRRPQPGEPRCSAKHPKRPVPSMVYSGRNRSFAFWSVLRSRRKIFSGAGKAMPQPG